MKKTIDITKEPLDSNYEDENFESVSCFDNASVYPEYPPPPIPTMITLTKSQFFPTNNNIQTRIIPCKYAVRDIRRLGDKCSSLHDGK
jgi:hypothetical protein